VVVRQRRVLLVRRRVQEAGFSWGFVGGEVEAGETPKEAAVRELREEVGLTIGATARIGERVHPQSGRRLIYVACGELAGEARLLDREELAEMAWCTLEELDQRIPAGIFAPVRGHLERMLGEGKEN
jgi:8-oxo-dGTP diphosphatase